MGGLPSRYIVFCYGVLCILLGLFPPFPSILSADEGITQVSRYQNDGGDFFLQPEARCTPPNFNIEPDDDDDDDDDDDKHDFPLPGVYLRFHVNLPECN